MGNNAGKQKTKTIQENTKSPTCLIRQMGLFLFLKEPILRGPWVSAWQEPLVLEVEFAVAEFDDDGAVVVHFAGDDLLAQFVEDEAL